MTDRRGFLKASVLGASAAALAGGAHALAGTSETTKRSVGPRVVSTWDFGVAANQAAWGVLSKGGGSLDAVEAGVMIPEADLKNHSVGRALFD